MSFNLADSSKRCYTKILRVPEKKQKKKKTIIWYDNYFQNLNSIVNLKTILKFRDTYSIFTKIKGFKARKKEKKRWKQTDRNILFLDYNDIEWGPSVERDLSMKIGSSVQKLCLDI